MVTYSLDEEIRLRKEFSDDISRFGLELGDMLGKITFDGYQNCFLLHIHTKIYPLVGNSTVVKILKNEGYDVTVFTNSPPDKHKSFYVSKIHPVTLGA